MKSLFSKQISIRFFSKIPKMDDLISLCKRRGFVYPSSEIYNSISGFYDYGHLGIEMKNNLKRLWWKEIVYKRSDIVGLDSSIISSPIVWKASGHIDGFSDPLLDCKESKIRIRADHAYWSEIETISKKHVGYICLMEEYQAKSKQFQPITPEYVMKVAKTLAKKMNIQEPIATPQLHDLTKVPEDILPLLPSPITGTIGVLTPPRDFNLMFRTFVGAVTNSHQENDQEKEIENKQEKEKENEYEVNPHLTYLRPETAQGIFTNYLNVQRSARMKVSLLIPIEITFQLLTLIIIIIIILFRSLLELLKLGKPFEMKLHQETSYFDRGENFFLSSLKLKLKLFFSSSFFSSENLNKWKLNILFHLKKIYGQWFVV